MVHSRRFAIYKDGNVEGTSSPEVGNHYVIKAKGYETI